ncbi:MAG: RNA methyltransferase [Thiobacillaceae bacterium]|nr:RNA methyltransferase [Thiobacillaceae bacterium]
MKSISSRDNPLYRELRALATDRRARREAGRTLLDGPHLLEAAVQAGIPVERLVYAESALAGELGAWRQRLPGVPVLVLPERLLAGLTPVDTPTGLLAQIAIPRQEPVPGGCIVLLENIQDPGNLGALLRVSAAAGMRAVHLSSGCAEVWSPKCLRGGQGAHFRLAIREGQDLTAVARDFPGTLHAAVLGAGDSLWTLDLRGCVGFAFGNEGAGLSEALRQACRPFTIPMAAGVESLNVAAAAAVCLFERLRQSGID